MIFLGKILDAIFKKVPHRFLEKFRRQKISWIFIYQTKIKLVVPLQLLELRAFKWTSVTLPDL